MESLPPPPPPPPPPVPGEHFVPPLLAARPKEKGISSQLAAVAKSEGVAAPGSPEPEEPPSGVPDYLDSEGNISPYWVAWGGSMLDALGGGVCCCACRTTPVIRGPYVCKCIQCEAFHPRRCTNPVQEKHSLCLGCSTCREFLQHNSLIRVLKALGIFSMGSSQFASGGTLRKELGFPPPAKACTLCGGDIAIGPRLPPLPGESSKGDLCGTCRLASALQLRVEEESGSQAMVSSGAASSSSGLVLATSSGAASSSTRPATPRSRGAVARSTVGVNVPATKATFFMGATSWKRKWDLAAEKGIVPPVGHGAGPGGMVSPVPLAQSHALLLLRVEWRQGRSS